MMLQIMNPLGSQISLRVKNRRAIKLPYFPSVRMTGWIWGNCQNLKNEDETVWRMREVRC